MSDSTFLKIQVYHVIHLVYHSSTTEASDWASANSSGNMRGTILKMNPDIDEERDLSHRVYARNSKFS